MGRELIFPMEEKYQEYLIDESKFAGTAESISFPETEAEVIEIINEMRARGTGITIQSGKTGIVGGAVPQGGHIMNLSAMNRFLSADELPAGRGLITVQAGMNLMDLNKEIGRQFKKTPRLWPVQPTETSAAVGGILASGAQGINMCYYGKSRQYVQSIKMVCADGNVRVIEQGQELDMILGSEGIYGVIIEASLILLPKPESTWGISFFFESLADIGEFAEKLSAVNHPETAFLTAVEYLDRTVLDMIEQRKSTMSKIKELPEVDPQYSGMVYLEIAGEEEAIEEYAGELMEAAAECNSDPDQAWAVLGDSEIEKMRAYRHAAAETANLYIEEMRRSDKRITKLGTDMTLDGSSFAEVVAMYRAGMKSVGLNGCIFGHMTGNHLHVNLLPRDYDEYLKGRELIRQWTEEAAAKGQCITAEHGIGKLKSHLTDLILNSDQQAELIKRKAQYDPDRLWNRNNIFPEVS